MGIEEKNFYVGIKKVEAYPEMKNDIEGYAVIYPDGYKSWCPKDVFESAYFKIDNADKLTPKDIERLLSMSTIEVQKISDKTTLVRVILPTGFEYIETSSCVSPENYSEKIGTAIALEKIKNKLWENAGFILQWAKYGLKK